MVGRRGDEEGRETERERQIKTERYRERGKVTYTERWLLVRYII